MAVKSDEPQPSGAPGHVRQFDRAPDAAAQCPQCHGSNTVVGSLRSYGHNLSGVFRPKRLKPFSLTMSGGVELFGDFHACVDCGTIWGQEDRHRIADFVRRNCT